MDRVFVNGCVTADVQGDGPPLLMLHSLLSDRASFDGIVPELSARFRTLVPELPGFGRSAPAAGGLPAAADRMADLLREAAGGTPAILLGNGFGSFVALQMAIRHPDLIDRIVLTGCGLAFSDPGREAFRNMARISREKGLEAITDTVLRRLFSPEFQAAHPALTEDRRAAFLRTDPEVFRAACDALATLDLRDRIGGVTLPALLLVGENDEATPPPMARELAAAWSGARLEILPGCAHVPQLQAPRQFLDAVAGFLAA